MAGSRRKGGELRAVESGTALCSLLCYAPALPPPQHPHLRPCSLPVRPLLRSGLAGMLTFTRTHPLCISHPSLSCKIGRNKGEAASSATSRRFVCEESERERESRSHEKSRGGGEKKTSNSKKCTSCARLGALEQKCHCLTKNISLSSRRKV